MALVILEDMRPTPPRSGWAPLALGFRPFYLLASVFAALSVPLWALQFAGLLPGAYLAGPAWHAHEMVFGFALAVIVGFLFTAGRNWSNQPTPTGARLAALAALWLAARVLVLTPEGWAAALANVAFPWAAALALWRAFRRSPNRRNDFFVGLLVLIGVAAGAFHAQQLGLVDVGAQVGRLGVPMALDVVLFIAAVMAGRVIPMFTNNGLPGAGAQRHPMVERVALGLLLALMAHDVLGGPAVLGAVIAAAAAVAHAARWAMWRPWRTLRAPLVWVLHLAYAWVPLHLLLRLLADLGVAAPSLAHHALTVGAIGGLVIGMMTRTAKGHTGRPLQADAWDVACYGLVALAALVRVALPLVAPGWTVHAVMASATLWSAGFALYAWRYAPVLMRTRLDGRPG